MQGKDGLRARMYAEFLEYLGHMGFDRRLGDLQLIGDLFVEHAFYQLRRLAKLLRSQSRDRRRDIKRRRISTSRTV